MLIVHTTVEENLKKETGTQKRNPTMGKGWGKQGRTAIRKGLRGLLLRKA